MANDLRRAFSMENLKRAWLWTKTNADARFKNYFRHVYGAYSLCSEDNLNDLRLRLTREVFQPSHATKLYFPKKSGILRPYSLLQIEDQIVYQALVNIVAERLLPRVRRRYYTSVFGNLYAGRRSLYFYGEWRKGYRKFSECVRSSYARGYKYAASFDLTACYDSIDHGVLKHFLMDIGLERELCKFLCNCLRRWMAYSGRPPIYQEHGIPQGPLPSGLLSECVLRYFDTNNPKSSRVRYFRYVDDIRLMAKSEMELRKKLIELDMYSKDIGLFPQTGKIDVHRIADIDNEIKSISHPPEVVSRTPDVDQKRVRKRLKELSKSFNVSKETRFKYVLAGAVPNASLHKRLLIVVRRQPHLYVSIFNYLSKSRNLTKAVSKECVELLKEEDLYPAFTAALLRALQGRFHESVKRKLINYCRRKLWSRDPEVHAVSGAILLENGMLSYNQVKRLSESPEWWVRSTLIKHIRGDLLGGPSHETILNKLLRDSVADVAIVAAETVISNNLGVHTPRRDVHKLAQFALKAAGVIGRISSAQCYISDAMVEVLGPRVRSIDWRAITGRSYRSVLRKIVRWRGYSESDATAFVNIMDTINDTLLDLLFRHDGTIGNYTLGNLGRALNPNSRFAKSYPRLFIAVREVHSKRLESDLSHPVNRRTGRFTGIIRFRDLRRIKQVLLMGYLEMWGMW